MQKPLYMTEMYFFQINVFLKELKDTILLADYFDEFSLLFFKHR